MLTSLVSGRASPPDTGTNQICVEVVMPGVAPIARRALPSGVHSMLKTPAQRAGPSVRSVPPRSVPLRSVPPTAGTRTGAPRYPALPGVPTPIAIDFPSGDHTGAVVIAIGALADFNLRGSDPSRRVEIN